MKKLLVILALIPAMLIAQQTYVPDDNFEQALINLGLDSPPLNDSVPTKNIDKVTTLFVNRRNIKDLTGIEDFKALTVLACSANALTSLDVSNNIALTELNCDGNKLSFLNIRNCQNLKSLECRTNNLRTIDLFGCSSLHTIFCYSNQIESIINMSSSYFIRFHCSNNLITKLEFGDIAVRELFCYNNKIENLDLSKQGTLYVLWCFKNNLKTLNIKNGNNRNMISIPNQPDIVQVNATDNPNLFCIQVDDASWSDKNSYWRRPANAHYSEDCGYVSVEEERKPGNSVTLSPNPATDYIEVGGVEGVNGVMIYDVLGNVVLSLGDSPFQGNDMRGVGNDIFVSSEGNVRIDVSSLSPGVYFVKIGDKVLKFIKI